MHDQQLYLSPTINLEICPSSLKITISLTVGASFIFLQSEVEKLLAWPGIEPAILDFDSQSVACDLSANLQKTLKILTWHPQIL